jgi:small redox-active disulfide protein 2
MLVEILGTGCPKCAKLAENAEKAVKEAGVSAEVKKVKEITEIMKRGVMFTPALSVNGVVKSVGKIPTVEEIKGWLAAAGK